MDEITGGEQYQQYIPDVNFNIIRNMVGWATFKAVMDIIGGALACLGIITAAYGIPQIIAGTKLLGTVDEIKGYMYSGDTSKLNYALGALQGFFKLTGVSIIIQLIFIVLAIVLYVAFIAYIISNPDFIRNLPGGGGFGY